MLSVCPVRLLMKRTAQCWWIISSVCMLLFVCGSQTTSAYSTMGLQRLVYASSFASFGALYMRCLMPPRIFFDFVLYSSMCKLNFKSDWRVTPRYLVLSVHSRGELPSVYVGLFVNCKNAYCFTFLLIKQHFPLGGPFVDRVYNLLRESGHKPIVSGWLGGQR